MPETCPNGASNSIGLTLNTLKIPKTTIKNVERLGSVKADINVRSRQLQMTVINIS